MKRYLPKRRVGRRNEETPTYGTTETTRERGIVTRMASGEGRDARIVTETRRQRRGSTGSSDARIVTETRRQAQTSMMSSDARIVTETRRQAQASMTSSDARIVTETRRQAQASVMSSDARIVPETRRQKTRSTYGADLGFFYSDPTLDTQHPTVDAQMIQGLRRQLGMPTREMMEEALAMRDGGYGRRR